jgi:hypothetical protein
MMYYGTVLLNHGDHSCRPCKEESGRTCGICPTISTPPSYDHDVDNIGLSFKELKQCQIEQALQQCQDRNNPLAKAMIDMIEKPPPPFESSDDDDKTIDAVEEEEEKDKNQSSKLAIKKDSKKR